MKTAEEPRGPSGDRAAEPWDTATADALIHTLAQVRRTLVERERRMAALIERVEPRHRPSATNLVHYLALRGADLRTLQDRLAWMGVSSLGRAETHVLANVDKVLGLLHRIAGRPWAPLSADEPVGMRRGGERLLDNAGALLGAEPAARATRILVTLPSEAAHDAALLRRLVDAGMDLARINCAHDDAAAWTAMAAGVRAAAAEAGRELRVLMDLGGPKLRTGALEDGPAVLRLKPVRDALGRCTAPAELELRPRGADAGTPAARPVLEVDAHWLQRLEPGDRVAFTDARGSRRRLRVAARLPTGHALLLGERSAYLTPATVLHLRHGEERRGSTTVGGIAPAPGRLLLERGDLVDLVAGGIGRAGSAGRAEGARRPRPARVPCTLPEALPCLRRGERVWFDDGKIGGVVRTAGRQRVRIEITSAREGGDWLAADKGINLPDTRLDLPALTAQDLADLDTVARLADIVGLSFAQSAADVDALHRELRARGATQAGIVLKIETRRGFDRLPELLLAAMAAPAAGVMIARGDLAVECGWERMAEVQEEILWACEAAHLPVIWATQVLETLARTGQPSRAEISDAAMGARAECVMLNKGPHIAEAMAALDDILRRMQQHQAKKRPLLRALKSWRMAPGG